MGMSLKQFNRRSFLGGSLCGVAAAAGSSLLWKLSESHAAKDVNLDTLFLTWQRDPTTTMTAQWVGGQRGKGSFDHPLLEARQATMEHARAAAAAVSKYTTTRASCGDGGAVPRNGVSISGSAAHTIHRFRTMPAKATNEFQFISGGDCGVNEHVIANNMIAAKQDPMFAVIGGDLAYDNGKHANTCLEFVRNYSRHMIDSQGRLIPMVVCIGNHDVRDGYDCQRKDGPYYFALHGGLYSDRTFATLDFGDYLSLVLLDTGHVSPIAGEQTDWLERTLRSREDRPHLIVVNHVPAYPSYRSTGDESENGGTGQANRKHWVPLFEKHNVSIVLEHHDHTFKRTRPLLGGLVDKRGIIYLGDGSWGKQRVPQTPEQRDYLAVTDRQYHLTLHRLEGDQAFHMALSEYGKVMDVCTSAKRAAI